ncbi:DUF3857 domain-containing protein [Tenacibaculum crassostreae]|uniref:DUF3857 domain-containing protein n=1 Tax=Tenacibaculum crassostreae TaxID=502683 RepID=UPI003893B52C
MKKNYIVFIVFTLFFTVLYGQVKKTNVPDWVTLTEYEVNPKIDLEEVDQGSLLLLYDEQVDIDTQEDYFKSATKITDNVGIQNSSTINVVYDPNYQKLFFHTLFIIRNGEKINKLNSSEFNLLRRELNAENYIYDGSITAMTNISDVRVGDIIEYSYTIKGFNPIHNGKYACTYNLETSTPVGFLFLKIQSKNEVHTKLFNSNIEIISKKKNGKNIYVVESKDVKPFDYEENTPSWHITSGVLNISCYSNNWKEIIDWGINVFTYEDKLSRELEKKINNIQEKNKTEGGRIKETLDFVQNEIRYLGLENGIGAFKPFPPNKVYKQRYGDCKDKSLLFVTMLKKMGIEAYPMLVNTYLKSTINELLPSAYFFDHCVVKIIDSNKNEFYYDPTITNQGGKYNNTPFPDYRYGLVLKGGNTELEEITPVNNNLVEIIDSYVLDKETRGASLDITSVYYSSEADAIREYYKNNSISSIKKEYENYYSNYHSNIHSKQNPEFIDDLKENKLTVIESYQIDSIWKSSVFNDKQLIVEFQPYSILNLLSMPSKNNRETPFYLNYPAERKHKTIVKLPGDWDIDQSSFSVNNDNIFYDMNVYYNNVRNVVTIDHDFKSKKDHVTVDEFGTFYSDLKRLDSSMGYSIMKYHDVNSSSNWHKILGPIIFVFLLVFYSWLAVKIYKYDPKPVIEPHFEKNKQIGGWLILIAIGLCISPFSIIINLFSNDIYVTGEWILLSMNSNLMIGVLFFIEVLFNSLVLVFFPLAIALFFKKRSSFPKVYSIFLIANFVFIVVDYFLANSLSNKDIMSPSVVNTILRLFITTSIIVPYLLISDRSKETFVVRLNKKSDV